MEYSVYNMDVMRANIIWKNYPISTSPYYLDTEKRCMSRWKPRSYIRTGTKI